MQEVPLFVTPRLFSRCRNISPRLISPVAYKAQFSPVSIYFIRSRTKMFRFIIPKTRFNKPIFRAISHSLSATARCMMISVRYSLLYLLVNAAKQLIVFSHSRSGRQTKSVMHYCVTSSIVFQFVYNRTVI